MNSQALWRKGLSLRSCGLTCLEILTLSIWHLCVRIKAEKPLTTTFFTWSGPDEKVPLKGSEAQENCLLTTQQPSYCGCQACVAWGIPLGNRLIVHFHGSCTENEREKGNGEREMNEGKQKKTTGFYWNGLLFGMNIFSVFKLKSVINNKRMFIVESYANALVLDKHYSAFPLGLLRIDFLFLQLILSSGMCSQRQGNLGGLPLHPRFPIISCFILSGNCCRNNGLPFQKCFAYLCWIYLN